MDERNRPTDKRYGITDREGNAIAVVHEHFEDRELKKYKTRDVDGNIIMVGLSFFIKKWGYDSENSDDWLIKEEFEYW